MGADLFDDNDETDNNNNNLDNPTQHRRGSTALASLTAIKNANLIECSLSPMKFSLNKSANKGCRYTCYQSYLFSSSNYKHPLMNSLIF